MISLVFCVGGAFPPAAAVPPAPAPAGGGGGGIAMVFVIEEVLMVVPGET